MRFVRAPYIVCMCCGAGLRLLFASLYKFFFSLHLVVFIISEFIYFTFAVFFFVCKIISASRTHIESERVLCINDTLFIHCRTHYFFLFCRQLSNTTNIGEYKCCCFIRFDYESLSKSSRLHANKLKLEFVQSP